MLLLCATMASTVVVQDFWINVHFKCHTMAFAFAWGCNDLYYLTCHRLAVIQLLLGDGRRRRNGRWRRGWQGSCSRWHGSTWCSSPDSQSASWQHGEMEDSSCLKQFILLTSGESLSQVNSKWTILIAGMVTIICSKKINTCLQNPSTFEIRPWWQRLGMTK